MRIRKQGLSFDDVLLVPRRSHIQSRRDISLRSQIVKGVEVDLPVLAANMDSVTGLEMARAMHENGGIGVLHRFASDEDILAWGRELGEEGSKYAFSIGINDLDMSWIEAMFGEGLASFVVIDVAHGHHDGVINTIKRLKDAGIGPIMAGNIATGDAAGDLCEAGADGLKVGVGPGSHCTTRIETGSGMPQLSAVAEAAEVAAGYGVPVCADGGIRAAGDIVKALAGGAGSVMVGRLLAGTDEAPGQLMKQGAGSGEVFLKEYRGSASMEAKVDSGREARNVEGTASLISYQGPVAPILSRLSDGVRSGFSYAGVDNISDLHKYAEFVEVRTARNVGRPG